MAIVDDADDLNDEAANAFLKTLEEPPPGAVLILIGTSAELQLETIVSRCQVVRFDPLPEPELAALLAGTRASRPTRPRPHRLARAGRGERRPGPRPGRPRARAVPPRLIDELAAEHGFDPPALAQRIEAFIKQAGKESVDQRGRASLLIGELARFFRGVLWQTAGLDPPLPRPRRPPRRRRTRRSGSSPRTSSSWPTAASRPTTTSSARPIMPVILESLLHDLAKVINAGNSNRLEALGMGPSLQ